MKKLNKQLNLSINYRENLYKIMSLIKMNMNLSVIFFTKFLDETKIEFYL